MILDENAIFNEKVRFRDIFEYLSWSKSSFQQNKDFRHTNSLHNSLLIKLMCCEKVISSQVQHSVQWV